MLSGAVCLLDISDVEWNSTSECWIYQMFSGAVCLNVGHIRF